MVALGAYLLVSVAAATPARVDKLASMYEDATCDAAEGGECIVELDISVAPTAAILDCESPMLHDMIGSCDNPKPALPTLHVATLHPGNGISVARTSRGEHFSVVSATSSVDAALPFRAPRLIRVGSASPVVELDDAARPHARASRLERPPRV